MNQNNNQRRGNYPRNTSNSYVDTFIRDQGLKPIEEYIRTAIESLKNKIYSCEWEPFSSSGEYQLSTRYYTLTPYSQIKIASDKEGVYKIYVDDEVPSEKLLRDELLDEDVLKLKIGKGSSRRTIEIKDINFQDITATFPLDKGILDEDYDCEGYTITFKKMWELPQDLTLLMDGNPYPLTHETSTKYTLELVVTPNATLSVKDHPDLKVTLTSAPKKVYPSGIYTTEEINTIKKDKYRTEDRTADKLSSLTDTEYDSHKNTISSKNDIGDTLKKLGFEFKKVVSKDNKTIRLIEPEEKDDEKITISPLEAFYDTKTDVKCGSKAYSIRNPNKEMSTIQLIPKGERNPVYPPEGKQITTKPDLNSLYKQKDAIQALSKVQPENQNLIKLFEDRDKVKWADPEPIEDIQWKVLTDATFKGSDKQQAFVKKALSTPDFAFLDGPPGTGKTTTILELIYQIVIQGKKVLLCASTHAAINNVIEKIMDQKLDDTIFTYRVGDAERATGIEKYSVDKLQDSLGDSNFNRLLLESSNLICGTTIGILRLLGDSRKIGIDFDKNPIIFDYLIIDESSKTTFQEFLVPARFAKKWILSGDIKQLSPFTDRGEIVSNINSLDSEKRGKASYLLFMLDQWTSFYDKDNKQHYQNKFIVIEDNDTIKKITDELKAIKKEEKNYPKTYHISTCNKGTMTHYDREGNNIFTNDANDDWLGLVCRDIIFIDKDTFESKQHVLPTSSHIVISATYKEINDARFNHMQEYNCFSRPLPLQIGIKDRGRSYTGKAGVQEFITKQLQEKSWGKEYAWRLERIFWLRQSKKDTKNFKKALEKLKPKAVSDKSMLSKLNRVEHLALTSILEALIGDGIHKQRRDEPTTLNSGFDDNEKSKRYETLTYQHRMHPDISKFSRVVIYNDKSLIDGNVLGDKREWGYNKYPSRAIWIDTKDKFQEIEVILKELKEFITWAKNNPNGNVSWEVAILTFYKKQEKLLRESLQKLSNSRKNSLFEIDGVMIKLATVDFFQGQEADMVFLSMVNNNKDGFMDSPNRINVAVTRARYQQIIVGTYKYYAENTQSEELKKLTQYYNKVGK